MPVFVVGQENEEWDAQKRMNNLTVNHARLASIVKDAFGGSDEGTHTKMVVEGHDMFARVDDEADTLTLWGFWNRPLTPQVMPLARSMANRINTGELAPRVSVYTSSEGATHLLCDMAVSTAAGLSDAQITSFLDHVSADIVAALAFFDEMYAEEFTTTDTKEA